MRRSSLAALAASVGVVALGFLVNVLVSRGLGPSGKGAYDLAMATATLLTLVLGLSLQSGLTYAIARREVDPRGVLPAIAALAALQGATALAILLLVPGIAGRIDAPTALLIGAMVAISSLTGGLRALLVGRELVVRASIMDVVGRALVVAAVLVAFMVGIPATFAAVLFGTAVGMIAALALQWVAVRPALRAEGGTGSLRPALSFAVPAHLGNVIQSLNYRLGLFLVGLFAGTAGVGIYALAVSLAQLVWLLSNPLATVLLPRVASGAEARDAVARMARLAFAASILAALALAVVAVPLLSIAFGDAFASAYEPLLLLLPGVVVFSLVNVVASFIGGRGRPQANTLVALAALVVTIALDLALIPSLGPRGAAIANTVSYATSAVLTLIMAARLGLPIRAVAVPNTADVRWLRAEARALLC